MGKEAATIEVPSKDPKKEEDPNPKGAGIKETEDNDLATDELSEEDQKLKEDLELAVDRICDLKNENGVHKLALELLCKEIRTATSSMTSVPKPLKFLRPSYDQLKEAYEKYSEQTNKKTLSDILAVLAMTMAKPGLRESLKYKLLGNPTDIKPWGHEFVRSLAGEVGEEYASRTTQEGVVDADVSDLLAIVDAIVPFHIQHNAEPEAVDILIEVQKLEKLLESKDIDEKNYQRVCMYLLACADFMSDQDDLETLLKTAYQLYKRCKQFPDALRVALRIDDQELVTELFTDCSDSLVKRQMAYILGRHHVNHVYFDYDESDETIQDIICNTNMSETFVNLARDLDVTEAKAPEEIYKSHLSETSSTSRSRDTTQNVDSARHNLASTFVNAFVNCGYGVDKLMTSGGNSWIYKNKDHGMMSAAASLGMIMLWNVEEGLTQIDKFLYSGEDYIKAGAILGVGIVSSGVRNECDPALALLSEHVDSKSEAMKIAACCGLGMAYAGSGREEPAEMLMPIVSNTEEDAKIQEVALAALSLGLIYVGTCDEEVGSVLMQRLMESSDAELDNTMSRFLCLGLGLLFLGKQERADAMMEAVKTIDHKIGKYAAITLETCAYAGTGNVLKVQEMLHQCAEHLEDNAAHQTAAMLGIALITMGENVGSEMAIRTYDHLLQYGELPIRRSVPLALALLSISNPDYAIVDTLSRLTHDTDAEVAQSAILALGLVGAGTNNSRIAKLLRQLSEFYHREANHLFIVRIAQGILHMGKGLVSIQPYHSDRLLLSKAGLGGILTVLHAALDIKNTLLDKSPFLLYFLVVAMNPKMLITVDEDLKPLPVSVRVGQAVEVVGQAGRPKSITGFQTHKTPVLLKVQDRAELATEEYIPVTNVLEGMVILKKNPDYVPET